MVGDRDNAQTAVREDTTDSGAGRIDRHLHRSFDGSDATALLLLMLFGFLLRLFSMDARGFWLDEATTVRQASWSLPLLIAKMANNVHPPFFHILMHFWIGVFGKSEFAVRAFAMMFGIAAMPLAHWAGRTIYDRRTGIMATALVAVSPFLVWYSQEARMYSMMLVFSLLSTTYFWLAVREDRPRYWVAYALSTLMGLYTQYFFMLLVAGQGVYYLWFEVVRKMREKRAAGELGFSWRRPAAVLTDIPTLGPWMCSMMAALGLFFSWMVPVLFEPVVSKNISEPLNYGWGAPAFALRFNEFILVPVEIVFGFHSRATMHGLVAMWPLLLPLAFLLLVFLRPVADRTWFLLISGAGSAAVIVALGQWQPILSSRYFIAAAAPLFLLAARLFSKWNPRALAIWLPVLAISATISWADQSFDPKVAVRWDNREALGMVSRDFRDGDVILLVPFFARSIAEFYLPTRMYKRVTGFPKFDSKGHLRNEHDLLSADLRLATDRARRVWVVSSWQDTRRIWMDRLNITTWLEENGFAARMDRRLHQVRVQLFMRERPRPGKPEEPAK